MEIVRYEAPFDYQEIFDPWTEIFGVEEPQVDGSETKYNRDLVYVAKEGEVIPGVISFYDIRENWTFEPGDFIIEIGKSCKNVCFAERKYIEFQGCEYK